MVAAVDAAAQVEGLAPGMTLAHAQMLVPAFLALDADPPADLVELGRLALWCQQRYAPLTSVDPPNGLWLDVTGCTHFWPEEMALLTDIRDRLGRFGIAGAPQGFGAEQR